MWCGVVKSPDRTHRKWFAHNPTPPPQSYVIPLTYIHKCLGQTYAFNQKNNLLQNVTQQHGFSRAQLWQCIRQQISSHVSHLAPCRAFQPWGTCQGRLVDRALKWRARSSEQMIGRWTHDRAIGRAIELGFIALLWHCWHPIRPPDPPANQKQSWRNPE